MPFQTPALDDTTTDCTGQLCEIAGRDRAVAAQLRAQATKLVKLAEVLESNSSIASSAAGDLLAGK
ncbi:hypothetical protein AYK61_02550 [Rhodococcus sp. SBT000017]|uniref:hypothetical protein n=1 Tax=unclassified Rhodococcus (in: high G+C Gram-positive bacteria) TaxID=192944 RepID=UPI000AEFA94C|nr:MULTISPECIES: hypothetical protein [unclassified Rhodococcus (in: high G+C Gram-positive bacteria)]RMB75637.1 hypothetical protein AYK61_02550 [Rhodococcus sp. SBT000017]